ncbi:homing endonuclease [Serratia phage 92A1]|nr:homing endonuclease [Serratia phage 92A1]
MNYQKLYDSLVTKGKARGLNKKNLDYYTESHHIIPKSLGGRDSINNLVLLTAREHFIAHLLLTKIYNNPQMYYALWRMCNYESAYKVNSNFYEMARIHHSRNVSELFKGKIRSEEHKINLSKALKGRNSPTEGKSLPKETRQKISGSLIGKKQSTETRLKRSKAQIGKPKELYPACPHCGLISSKATAVRWHYNNCKHKAKK